MGNYTSLLVDLAKRSKAFHSRRAALKASETKSSSGLYITGLGGQYPSVVYKAADLEHVVRSQCASHIESPG